VELLTRVDRGERSLDEMIALTSADIHPGSGTLSQLFQVPGIALSLRNLMELMLLISDNSATDVVLREAGGGEAVTARMRALGIEGIRVDRPTSLLIGDFLGVRELPEDGNVSLEEFRRLSGRFPRRRGRKPPRVRHRPPRYFHARGHGPPPGDDLAGGGPEPRE
jgi:beta-lactamase class A